MRPAATAVSTAVWISAWRATSMARSVTRFSGDSSAVRAATRALCASDDARLSAVISLRGRRRTSAPAYSFDAALYVASAASNATRVGVIVLLFTMNLRDDVVELV